MSIYALAVSEVVGSPWDYYPKTFTPKKGDTYILIFSIGQDRYLEEVIKNPKYKILYKGIKARNKRPGHGDYGRNTIVIFEKNDTKA